MRWRSAVGLLLLLLAVAALTSCRAQRETFSNQLDEDESEDGAIVELEDEPAVAKGDGLAKDGSLAGGGMDVISRLRAAEEAEEAAAAARAGSRARAAAADDSEEELEPLPASARAGGTTSGARSVGTAAGLGGAPAKVPRSEADSAIGADGSVPAKVSRSSEAVTAAGGSGSTGSSGDGTGAAAEGGAAKESTPAPAPQKFKMYNEQWLEQAEGIAEDFVSTPAMERLKSGQFGSVDLKELGIDGAASVATGVHAVFSRCLHTLGLFKTVNLFHDGVLPKRETLPECGHRKFRLLFVLEKGTNYHQRREVLSELASINIRLFPFAAALAKRGHTTLVADPDHLHQVDMTKLDAIIFVKVLEQGFQVLQNSSVPLVWDHVDEWEDFPFWDLEKWGLKETFTGVLTAGRMAKVAFDKAGIPAHVLYHNHANFANFHRADRTPQVKVIALQGDYHSHESDVFPMLEAYCERNNLTFRSGHYTGRGWEVSEFSRMLADGVPNHGGQLGWYMGFRSVDVAVLWPKGYTQFHICYKPTSRLAQFASLGIPVVTYPFVSYMDVLVEFGYPLVAETLEEAEALLDALVKSPELRQQASETLLEIAAFLSVEELSESYEQALCQFLSPEALALRAPVDEAGES